MTRLSLAFAALVCTTPVVSSAQDSAEEAGVFVTVLPEPRASDGAVGEIVHRNRPVFNFALEQFYEFETERGRIVLLLASTPNGACPGPNGLGCPDTLTVWEIPAGIYASEVEVDTPEMETTRIILFEWSGM